MSQTGPGNCQESERRRRREKKKTWEEKDGRRYRGRGQKKKLFHLIAEDQKKNTPPNCPNKPKSTSGDNNEIYLKHSFKSN